MEDVSKKIKKIRTKLNMSQERFGNKIGLSGKTISAYETGKCMPPLRILEKMSEVYNADFIQLNSDKKLNIEAKIRLIKEATTEIEEIFIN